MLADLPSELRALVQGSLALTWQPEHVYAPLLRSCLDATGAVSVERSQRMGREIGDLELRTIHRILMHFLRPETLVDKAVSIWPRHHDTGQWEVTRTPDGAVGELHDWAVVDELCCAQVAGYIDSLVAVVSPGAAPTEHTRCRGRGDGTCRFEFRFR